MKWWLVQWSADAHNIDVLAQVPPHTLGFSVSTFGRIVVCRCQPHRLWIGTGHMYLLLRDASVGACVVMGRWQESMTRLVVVGRKYMALAVSWYGRRHCICCCVMQNVGKGMRNIMSASALL